MASFSSNQSRNLGISPAQWASSWGGRTAPGWAGPGIKPPPGLRAGHGNWHGPGIKPPPGLGRPPGKPPGPPGKPPGPPGGGTGDPALDAQYYLNVANNQFKVNNQLNALNQQGAYANTDLQNALAQLSRQQPVDNLKAEQSANSRGSLFSTALGQNLGNINQGYLTRQSGDLQNFERGDAARQAQAQSLEAGVPLFDAGQYLAAVQRASLLAQKNPGTGESAKPLTKPPAGGHGGRSVPPGPGSRGWANPRTVNVPFARSNSAGRGWANPRAVHVPFGRGR